ncbi:leucine-rich repeat-containing protein 19 [Sorex araneus]|uniref:leucine-rich repeat-containing protein 19 n=1 Tax=Sorex araneus TaxID=42254 RepID=UPI00015814E2|nr:leucine-rich repeat-containing protein 19 [Sorex araneus]
MKMMGTLLWPLFSMLSLSEESQTSKIDFKYNFTKKNYSLIPADVDKNVKILDLSYNQITLNITDIRILQTYLLLTELYLIKNRVSILQNNSFGNQSNLEILNVCSNSIHVIQQEAFAGLIKLQQLHLCQNKILQLNPDVFVPLQSLTLLNLQSNLISYFDLPQLFHLESITLDGNPWNCSCSLLNLLNWLNTSHVTLENENLTTCSYPATLKSYSIKTAPFAAECHSQFPSSATEDLYINFQSISNSTFNSSLNNLTRNSEHEPIGKSWAFLVSVVVTVLVTSLVIFIAVKCPVWYNFLLSYQHHRLEEHEAETCTDGFTENSSSLPQIQDANSEETIIFKQLNSFVVDDDGFIEDKYIDTQELCEEK